MIIKQKLTIAYRNRMAKQATRRISIPITMEMILIAFKIMVTKPSVTNGSKKINNNITILLERIMKPPVTNGSRTTIIDTITRNKQTKRQCSYTSRTYIKHKSPYRPICIKQDKITNKKREISRYCKRRHHKIRQYLYYPASYI